MFITHQPQHHSDEQPQPDFRQAIRNAPINSFNPSVKALMKEFVFLTFAETLEAFRQLDPLNKVKYFHLYRQAVCADEDPRENNGEWMPKNNISPTGLKDDSSFWTTTCLPKLLSRLSPTSNHNNSLPQSTT